MYDLESMDKRLIVFAYLFRVANRLQSKMDALMQELTAKQWFLIIALGLFEQPPTLKQLAAACDTSHQNTKQLVLKLAKKGFVTISNDKKDGRAMRIAETEQCDRWGRENGAESARFVDNMFSGMDFDEIAALSKSLMKIYGNLDNYNGGTEDA